MVSILPGEAQWRSRKVRYYSGSWDAILTVLPEFDLTPFTAGQDEPVNPFLQTVTRRPLSAAERVRSKYSADPQVSIVQQVVTVTANRSQGTVKLSRILGFWRRNRLSVERRINNLGSGQGAD